MWSKLWEILSCHKENVDSTLLESLDTIWFIDYVKSENLAFNYPKNVEDLKLFTKYHPLTLFNNTCIKNLL